MSQAASMPGTTQSYTPPSVTQFSVFLDNRVGKLLELLKLFESHPACQVCAFSVQEEVGLRGSRTAAWQVYPVAWVVTGISITLKSWSTVSWLSNTSFAGRPPATSTEPGS